MTKLTEKQIEALKSIYPSSEFNTVGAKPWNNTWVWNVKEQFFLDDKRYTVVFDHGYGHIALFKGDTLISHAASGFIMTPELAVINHHYDDTSWVYINNNTSEILPYAEEHY